MSNLETINISVNTNQIEQAMVEMTSIIKESLIDVNNTIAELNNSMNSTGNTVSNVSSVVGSAAGVLFNLGTASFEVTKITENLGSIFSALTGPIGIATLAITGIIGVISLLSNYQSEETKKHNETMEAMNNEISARNDLRSKQEEQLQGNLSEITNLQSLNTELGNLTDANGKVKAGYEDRAAFIVSTLNKALGEQITIEDGVVKGYDKSSKSINEKIDKMKANQMQKELSNTNKIVLNQFYIYMVEKFRIRNNPKMCLVL
ncbi:hypothetical protein ACWG0P_12120 [Amedibacillus sp. YH-ame6]